ncbi:DUF6762 family protein [uncultured Tyzzerella sp.]|uniref:DUF6762 family protein n=1 Tax=uncultured Tyzzerella sp. TaxID=2321398 RepID=UPI002942B235|nr:DUF6762 family protein [uncultured Tyzzerella sp.]
MDTVIVIMQKNKKTGLFEKELQTLSISKYEQYILNIYALEDENSQIFLNIKLTTENDVSDWEYNAIYDYYDIGMFQEKGYDINECEEEYNPTWEIIIPYTENNNELINIVDTILDIHHKELEDVYNTIKDKEGEYKNEK